MMRYRRRIMFLKESFFLVSCCREQACQYSTEIVNTKRSEHFVHTYSIWTVCFVRFR